MGVNTMAFNGKLMSVLQSENFNEGPRMEGPPEARREGLRAWEQNQTNPQGEIDSGVRY